MKDDIKRIDIDKIYREMPLEKIPWNVESLRKPWLKWSRAAG